MSNAAANKTDFKRRSVLFPLALLISVSLISSACKPIHAQEIKRIESPSKDLEAVFVNWPSGALGDLCYGVVIVPRGHELPSKLDSNPHEWAIVMGESLMPETLSWIDSTTLRIKYQAPGKIFSFHNYWDPPQSVSVPRIEILLERVAEIPTKNKP